MNTPNTCVTEGVIKDMISIRTAFNDEVVVHIRAMKEAIKNNEFAYARAEAEFAKKGLIEVRNQLDMIDTYSLNAVTTSVLITALEDMYIICKADILTIPFNRIGGKAAKAYFLLRGIRNTGTRAYNDLVTGRVTPETFNVWKNNMVSKLDILQQCVDDAEEMIQLQEKRYFYGPL
jgi:hypothetical protein